MSINKIETKDLANIGRHHEILEVVFQEDRYTKNGAVEYGFKLLITYINSRDGMNTETVTLYSQFGEVRYWSQLDRAVRFWQRYVPDINEFKVKTINQIQNKLEKNDE